MCCVVVVGNTRAAAAPRPVVQTCLSINAPQCGQRSSVAHAEATNSAAGILSAAVAATAATVVVVAVVSPVSAAVAPVFVTAAVVAAAVGSVLFVEMRVAYSAGETAAQSDRTASIKSP